MMKRLLLLALTFGCEELPDIEATGRCGNLVLEPSSGEDCDTFSDPDLGPQTVCGAEDREGACRYVCGALDESARCPIGWRCGLDGLCREPSLEFDLAGPTESYRVESAEDVRLGDVDGDGRVDLIKVFGPAIEVRFGDETGTFERTTTFNIDSATGRFAAQDLDDDDRVDLVVPQQLGLLVALGDEDGDLSPVHFSDVQSEDPVLPRALPLDATPLWPFEELMILEPRPEGFFGYMSEDPRAGTNVFEGAMPDHIASADVDGDPHEEVALAAIGDTTVEIHRPQCSRTMVSVDCTLGAPELIQLPGPLLMGTRFADMDGDGAQDLVASITDDLGFTSVVVSHQDPVTGFEATARPDARLEDELGAIYYEEGSNFALPTNWPLATGDFDRDGRADFVTATQILATRSVAGSIGLTPRAEADDGFGWSEAVVADFNRDGFEDVATVTGGRPGITFFMGSLPGVFNRTRLPTDLEPTDLAIGDFDGDQFIDLAVVEGGRDLWVVFGDIQGAPSDRVFMGEFDFIDSITPVLRPEPADLVTDLLVGVRIFSLSVPGGPVGIQSSVVELLGTTERRMLAPLKPLPGNFPGDLIPRDAFVGEFSREPDGIPDLMVLSEILRFNIQEPGQEFSTFAVALFSGQGDGDFERLTVEDAVDLTSGCADEFRFECAVGTAGDLDGDGRVELVLVETDRSCPMPREEQRPPVVLSVDWSQNDRFSVSCRELTAPYELGAPTRVEIGDVDGDGGPDIIVSHYGSGDVGLPQQPGLPGFYGPSGWSGVAVYFNGSDVPVQLPRAEEIDASTAEAYLGAALLPTDGRVALLKSFEVVIGQLGPDGLEVEDRFAQQFFFDVFELDTPGILVGDANGDRIEDLVVISEGELSTFLRQPCTPLVRGIGLCGQGARP